LASLLTARKVFLIMFTLMFGPTKIASLGDHRYIVSLVDDLSRYCCVYPIRLRFEVLNVLMKWKKLMEKLTSKKKLME